MKVLVVVPDRPDSIARIGGMAAAQQAHIIDVHHRRAFSSAAYRETELDLLIETRGPLQSEALVRAMLAAGYRVQSVAPD